MNLIKHKNFTKFLSNSKFSSFKNFNFLKASLFSSQNQSQFKRKDVMTVTITGGAGNICYSILPLLCNGNLLGTKQKLNINLLDIQQSSDKLKSVAYEIEDGAYDLVQDINCHIDPTEAFKGSDLVILIGGVPHKTGMSRADLLKENAVLFEELGLALNQSAPETCKLVTVANPTNSLTTILAHYADKIPQKNFTALSRLDENRAKFQIAKKCGVHVSEVKNIFVWGNHGDSQYPETNYGLINTRPLHEVFNDVDWLHKDLNEIVSNRWLEIVKYRKATSCMSSANSIKDHVRNWSRGHSDDFITMAVISDGTKYGIPKGMCFALPCKCSDFEYEVADLELDKFSQERIDFNIREIENELSIIKLK